MSDILCTLKIDHLKIKTKDRNIPWFPEYLKLSIPSDVVVLDETIDIHHAYYYSCKGDCRIKLYYDGYEYYIADGKLNVIQANQIEFLNVTHRISSDKAYQYIINAWDEIIERYGNIGEQQITVDKQGYKWHEEIYNSFLHWNAWDSVKKLDYFPDYINIPSEDGHEHIYVLDHIISDNSAQYWRCSGEYGIRIEYNNHAYKQKVMGYSSMIENPINIEPATACQFILDNPQYKLDKTKRFYIKAIQEIEKTNPLFKKVSFDIHCGFSYVECEFNEKFKNWLS